MPNIQDDMAKIGADRTYQDPNDPALVGTYKDAAADMPPEKKSVLVNFPEAPAKKPFTVRGGV